MKALTIVLAAAAAAGSGCAGQFTFIDRKDGSTYHGSTTGGTMGGSGEATAAVAGRQYRGQWVYSPGGGGFTLQNATFNGSTGPRPTTFAGASTGSALSLSAQGNGLLTLRSDDQAQPVSLMRCVFQFNALSNTGMGECEREDGRSFDLVLKR